MGQYRNVVVHNIQTMFQQHQYCEEEWGMLPPSAQCAAKVLGYNRETWNGSNGRRNSTKKLFSSFGNAIGSDRAKAIIVKYNERQWENIKRKEQIALEILGLDSAVITSTKRRKFWSSSARF